MKRTIRVTRPSSAPQFPPIQRHFTMDPRHRLSSAKSNLQELPADFRITGQQQAAGHQPGLLSQSQSQPTLTENSQGYDFTQAIAYENYGRTNFSCKESTSAFLTRPASPFNPLLSFPSAPADTERVSILSRTGNPASVASGLLQQLSTRNTNSSQTHSPTIDIDIAKSISALDKQCSGMADVLCTLRDDLQLIKKTLEEQKLSSIADVLSTMHSDIQLIKTTLDKQNLNSFDFDEVDETGSRGTLTTSQRGPPRQEIAPVVKLTEIDCSIYVETVDEDIKKLVQKARKKRQRKLKRT